MKKIFELEVHEIGDGFDKEKQEFGTITHSIGVFSTRAKAEKMIIDWLEHVKNWHLIVIGFNVIERNIDQTFCGQFKEISEFEARWSYDAEGKMIADSPYDDGCRKRFIGRDNPVRFKVGDIVLVRGRDHMTPALIVMQPFMKDEWDKQFGTTNGGDCTDDCFTVVCYKHGHFHPNVTHVFPYICRNPTKDIEKKLWSELKRYCKDIKFDPKKLPNDRHGLMERWWEC